MRIHTRVAQEADIPVIHGDGITNQLFTRFICSYLLYDYNPDHAFNCFYNNEGERCRRAAVKAKEAPFAGRKTEQLTWAYNQVLSEEIEGLAAHICGGRYSRAEYEVMLAEMMEDYNKWPKYV